MTDGNSGRSSGGGFDQGLLSETIAQTRQMIEAWFDDLENPNYLAGYRKLALSGTTGALEALAKQQVGRTTSSGDAVDVPSFLADAWLGTVANAWAATRDINQQFLDDFSVNFGAGAGSQPKPPPAKKATKKAAKKRPATRARKPATK